MDPSETPNTSPGTEEELLRLARTGDQQALGALVRLHQRSVRVFVGRYLRDAALVDDVAQEAFITAFRKLPSYRADAPFSYWLLGIARLEVLLHLRGNERWRRRAAIALDEVLTEADLRELEAGEEALARRRSVEALQGCLEKLAPASAGLIAQHYFAGVPLGDLARRLGRREGALRVTLFRVRQALRECLERSSLHEGAAR
jgi:RNA polymerase sigma-70 factor (ECF subfamily)